MYGNKNPVLRHFGADQLATLGTLQAVEDRRSRGEFTPSSEAIVRRPTPEFDEFFEFDRPLPSGLPQSAPDLLVEDASSPAPARPRAAPVYQSRGNSPAGYNHAPDPSSPAASVLRASYDSSPSVGYQAAAGAQADGAIANVSGAGSSPELDPPSSAGTGQYPYDRYRSDGSGGGGTPDSGLAPARSLGSPGTSPSRRSYDQSPSIQQPPFRTGLPVSGPVRRPGLTVVTGDRRRRTSSPDSPSRSRSASRSASPSPIQQPSSDTANSEHLPAASHITSPGGSGSTTVTPRRSLRAKISGRPSGETPGGGGRGGGGGVTPRSGATPRRPAGAASPRGPSTSRTGGAWGAGGRNSATGGTNAPVPRVPAWAPASGISNMRLEDMDEATRVAMMLNDPEVRRDTRPQGNPRDGQESPVADSEQHLPPPPQQQPHLESQQPLPALQPSARSQSLGLGDRLRASEVSEHFYEQYRLRKHREPQGVPDFRFSQPRSYGAHSPLPQRYFCFDEAHPALAEQHYARSPVQERELQAERRKLQKEKARAAQAEARRTLTSARAVPSSQQLEGDVDRLTRVREAGRARLRELEAEGDTLRQTTRQVQRRAMDAIARSEQMTAAASRSPSPGASPALTRSRSRSPARVGYYSNGAAAYSRGAFGPPPSLYSRSPSFSPGQYRPASASPGSVYERVSPSGGTYDDGLYSARAYYGSPAAALAAQIRQQQQQQQVYVVDGYYNSGQQQQQQQQRPLSAPPRSQGGALETHGSDDAEEVLEILKGVERLPQHEQVPVDNAGTASAAGYPRRARSGDSSRNERDTLGPDEQRIAMGVYDRSRYEEYQRQVDLEMQRRAVEGDYDSDLERDEATDLLVEDREKLAAEEEARRRAEEEERARQDDWMDEYRLRLGPEDGYLPKRAQSASAGGSSSSSQPPALAAQRSVLSDAEEGLLQEHFVPVVSAELPVSPGAGYASEGPDGDHPHRRTRRRLFFKTTIPEPFLFEEREKLRPKPISKVKLEQDLAIRRAEEDAARNHRFRAKLVPTAVAEPRYERMLLEAEAKRQLNQEQRLEELASMMEKPFSFYYRDKEQQEEREALARAAKDPNRFQVSFRARAIPESTKEERFRVMMLELEGRREATRRRVEQARQAARERAAQEAQQRREAADRAYRERLRAVDPALHPYPPKPLGVLPDFNTLHRQNEVQMARARANIRKRVTVPQEFTLNGTTPEQQAARAQKAEERRRRIILDMQLDAEVLPEARWPYKSPRGKVRRTPPPAYLVEWMATQAPGNRSANARKTSTTVAATGGAYQTRAEREERERKASERLRAEALKRADRLLKAAQERRQQEAPAGGGGGGEAFGLASDVAATAVGGAEPSDTATTAAAGRGAAQRRRAAVAGRQDNPEVYVEARHAQVERRVREVVEETLLDQGIEAYRYVEGIAGDKKKAARGSRGVA
ncbi:hypothetical protein Vretimale_3452 [Volvox reticuliferus]|uniref:Uncharacterized protein n=1 Tax=Volvox reticuliferus TaxID=1737510 RepID=A0A8J4C2Q0_9CHLO|nr:hypothetical protein Vretifemale_969 [Volvox reticuliferus]GIL98053.1 hypothetical protein Vretimale_3452 [Volvox reticuliferus]